MKKYIVLIFAISITLFTSCKKDDKVTPEPEPSIVGKWNYSKTGGSETSMNDWHHQCASEKDYMDFSSDGAIVQKIHSNSSCAETITNYTYTFSGTTLTINNAFSGTTNAYQVLELTPTQLKIKRASTGLIYVYIRAN